ncbi:MAG: hypothetical protein E7650_00015 [Ruminococcaceae bacterium]|nr:hypothetical protein [Oscillospiraceae bacterium]
MKKTTSIAQIYLHQASFSVTDILTLGAMVISAVIFFINPWFCIPLLASFICFLLSRSAHVSDREYEKLLSHVLAFNAVREERQDGYETLYKFYEQGYLEKTGLTDFYLQGYDLGKGTVRCGDDKTLRSGFYRLSHLQFTDTHCKLYTCEADVVAGTVSADRRIVALNETPEITEREITYNGSKKKIFYLIFPYCQPIPVQPDSAEMDEIVSFFKK